MNEQIRSSAKVAREFLQSVADGIGKVETGAGEVARLGASRAAHLVRRLPPKWGGGGDSTYLIRSLVIAGVVASTAALIYAGTRAGKDARRRRGRH